MTSVSDPSPARFWPVLIYEHTRIIYARQKSGTRWSCNLAVEPCVSSLDLLYYDAYIHKIKAADSGSVPSRLVVCPGQLHRIIVNVLPMYRPPACSWGISPTRNRSTTWSGLTG